MASVKKTIRIFVVAAMSSAVMSAASPAHAQDDAGGGAGPVFVVRTGDETFGEAMRNLAASNSPDAQRADEIIREWDRRTNGEPASVSVVGPQASASWAWSDPNTWPVRGAKSSDIIGGSGQG